MSLFKIITCLLVLHNPFEGKWKKDKIHTWFSCWSGGMESSVASTTSWALTWVLKIGAVLDFFCRKRGQEKEVFLLRLTNDEEDGRKGLGLRFWQGNEDLLVEGMVIIDTVDISSLFVPLSSALLRFYAMHPFNLDKKRESTSLASFYFDLDGKVVSFRQ